MQSFIFNNGETTTIPIEHANYSGLVRDVNEMCEQDDEPIAIPGVNKKLFETLMVDYYAVKDTDAAGFLGKFTLPDRTRLLNFAKMMQIDIMTPWLTATEIQLSVIGPKIEASGMQLRDRCKNTCEFDHTVDTDSWEDPCEPCARWSNCALACYQIEARAREKCLAICKKDKPESDQYSSLCPQCKEVRPERCTICDINEEYVGWCLNACQQPDTACDVCTAALPWKPCVRICSGRVERQHKFGLARFEKCDVCDGQMGEFDEGRVLEISTSDDVLEFDSTPPSLREKVRYLHTLTPVVA